MCGGTLTIISLQDKEFDTEISRTVFVGLLLYLALDLYYFIKSPIINCAYEAHYAGFIIGVLGSLFLYGWQHSKREQVIVLREDEEGEDDDEQARWKLILLQKGAEIMGKCEV